MRRDSSKTNPMRFLVMAALGVLSGCNGGPEMPPYSAESLSLRAQFPDYCQASTDCEGNSPDPVHHVCMVSPIPFGMMLCQGSNESAKKACVASTETFQDEARAYGCTEPFNALANCLITKSVCRNQTYDQSACEPQMKVFTQCVDKASGNHAGVVPLAGQTTQCSELMTTCADCTHIGLRMQCQQIANIGDDGTCSQALTAVIQSCRPQPPAHK